MSSKEKNNLLDTFASHPKSQYWSDKNNVKPCDIPKNTSKKNIISNVIFVIMRF